MQGGIFIPQYTQQFLQHGKHYTQYTAGLQYAADSCAVLLRLKVLPFDALCGHDNSAKFVTAVHLGKGQVSNQKNKCSKTIECNPLIGKMPSNNRRRCLQNGGSFTAYCGCCRPAERHRGSKPYREEGHLQRHDSPQQLVGDDIL